MSHKWNPDPRWPEHIIGLALAVVNGEDCFGQLQDAFLELDLPLCAHECNHDGEASYIYVGKFETTPTWAKSYIIGFILQDGYQYQNVSGPIKEANQFLNSRTANVTS